MLGLNPIMRIISPKTNITLGLLSIMVSTMMAVLFMGLGPDVRRTTMAGRSMLCEAIAIDTSVHLSRNDMVRIRTLMGGLVDRNPDLISAGVRKIGGDLAIDINQHDSHWDETSSDNSTDTHVTVPLRNKGKRWGSVELRFQPIYKPGLIGWLTRPWTSFFIISGAISFGLFYFYLGYVLQQLDPSQAVPKRVRTALDTLTEGLLVTDQKGRVLLANQAFAVWAGRDAEKLVGRNASQFAWDVEGLSKDGREFRFPWMDAIELESAQAGVFLKLKDHEGRMISIIANSSPVLGSDGKYRGVLTSFEDVTELQQSKLELMEAKLEADDANRSKSKFLAHMSHEIRTPMNAILGYTEVLRSGSSETEECRQRHLNTIQASGQHLLSLINDILDLSKIESGRMDLEIKTCSLHSVFSQVLSVMKIKSDEKEILLNFVAEGKLPETIQSDEVRLRQVLINLIGNAIKFTEQGGVSIKTRLKNIDGRQMLEIDIADSGIGMSSEQLTRIFDPFSQADNSITRRFGGTGLGLAISRQLSEKLGGGIRVRSEVGEGSVFTVCIDPGDLEGVKLIELDPTSSNPDEVLAAPEAEFSFRGSRVLIVDDNETNRELISLFLRRSEVAVEIAENGAVAMQKAVHQKFDCILMDMQMPVMDGFTATRELRGLGHTMPIIALTANAMPEDERKCLDVGCSHFLPKPISKSRLLEMLADILPSTTNYHPTLAKAGSEASQTDSILESALEEFKTMSSDLSSCSSQRATPTRDRKQPVQTSSKLEPWTTTLPMDDEDYRKIVEKFVDRLTDQLPTFRPALESRQFEELADKAHWLKGSGGTAGFEDFTEPCKDLQTAAEEENYEEAYRLLGLIEAMSARIEVHAAPTN